MYIITENVCHPREGRNGWFWIYGYHGNIGMSYYESTYKVQTNISSRTNRKTLRYKSQNVLDIEYTSKV